MGRPSWPLCLLPSEPAAFRTCRTRKILSHTHHKIPCSAYTCFDSSAFSAPKSQLSRRGAASGKHEHELHGELPSAGTRELPQARSAGTSACWSPKSQRRRIDTIATDPKRQCVKPCRTCRICVPQRERIPFAMELSGGPCDYNREVR